VNRRDRRGPAAGVTAAAAVLSCLLAPALPALAQTGGAPATECCPELLLTIGGRALALGDAIVARSSPGSLFANPALLADVTDDQFIVHNADTAIGESNTFSLVIRSEVAGTFGLSYRLIDYGDQDKLDQNGIPVGSFGTLAHVLTASYATHVFQGLNAGVSYELYQFREDCRGFCDDFQSVPATTHSVDLGVQYVPRSLPALQLGAAVANLGFPLQVVNFEQASPLPLRLRVGAAYEAGHHFLADSAFAVWTSADLVTSPRDGRPHLNVGIDVSVEETVFVRAGYGGGIGLTGGAAAGIGVRYGRFEVDIAKSFVRSPIDDADPIQVSFSIRF